MPEWGLNNHPLGQIDTLPIGTMIVKIVMITVILTDNFSHTATCCLRMNQKISEG